MGHAQGITWSNTRDAKSGVTPEVQSGAQPEMQLKAGSRIEDTQAGLSQVVAERGTESPDREF